MVISVDIDISELTDEIRSELDLDTLITDAIADALVAEAMWIIEVDGR